MGPEPPRLDDVRLAAALAAALLALAFAARASRPNTPSFARTDAYRVDVNAAPSGEIEALPGVGRVLAERIVAERAKRRFGDLDDLRRVPGVGATTLARLRPFARCGDGR